jgi:hypothetical protein
MYGSSFTWASGATPFVLLPFAIGPDPPFAVDAGDDTWFCNFLRFFIDFPEAAISYT